MAKQDVSQGTQDSNSKQGVATLHVDPMHTSECDEYKHGHGHR